MELTAGIEIKTPSQDEVTLVSDIAEAVKKLKKKYPNYTILKINVEFSLGKAEVREYER